ncbi:protein FAM177B isoform X2 [Rhinatrema bivittatum]|uniref:protein FAM177B isoform X2 n=1 Tax=Rhinatrema bivittatum TaxID=194408 RepID=UPI0011262381|nr:protein FAM177B isoform X2 [Rhinatrema bivittatum]
MNKLEEIDLGKRKHPRRIIHFVSGDTMEEYSTEEEEEEEDDNKQKGVQNVDTSTLSWGPYLQFWVMRIATSSFFSCDNLGGKLAALFGLNLPKYQYAIDEHYRTERKRSVEDDEGMAESQEADALRERQHFPTQSVEYGAVSSSTNPVSCAGETTEHGLGNSTSSTNDIQ